MFNRIALASLIAAGCSSSSGNFEQEASKLEGIYSIASHTENLEACSPGDELPFGDLFAIAFYSDSFSPVLQFLSCPSLDECRALLDRARANEDLTYGFGFSATAASGDALVGTEVWSGFSDGGLCKDAEVTDITMRLVGEQLTIEERHTVAPDFPSDNGLCSTAQTPAHVEGESCSQLTLVAATRIEAL